MISGIIFFRSTQLKEVSHFYQKQVGCELWLDQGGCHILKFGNMLFGLCDRKENDTEGMITFVYPDKAAIDKIYEDLKEIAEAAPKDNPAYRIYHFFARDPEGRAIEFQAFWDEMKKI